MARRRRQVKADKAVEGPQDGDAAQQPLAPAVDAPELRDVQRVVQLVEEGDDILAIDRPCCAPFAPAELPSRRGIEEHLVVAGFVQPAGGRIDPGQDEDRQRLAGLGRHGKGDGLHARIPRLDLPRQLDRRDRMAGSVGFHQMRIEQVVELVVPRDHRARHARHEQEGRDRQADPSVNEREGKPHEIT
jgi:hypothetical protein